MEAKTLFHKSDPDTSRVAADKMIKSGKLNWQENKVWGWAHHMPVEFTAKELAVFSGLDYHLIQRRLSGLRNKGKIERTGEKRDGCCVWKVI